MIPPEGAGVSCTSMSCSIATTGVHCGQRLYRLQLVPNLDGGG